LSGIYTYTYVVFGENFVHNFREKLFQNFCAQGERFVNSIARLWNKNVFHLL
jgi:hypothetical protein